MSDDKRNVQTEERAEAETKSDGRPLEAVAHSALYEAPLLEDFAWHRIESERVADCRVFQVRRDRAVNPRGGGQHDFYCIEAADWINIIPLTARDEVVMVEQYRHGTNEVTLEIPGGMVDPGESPERAAARELLEETGYGSREVLLLGRTRPNPAIQNNWLYSFLAREVRFEHEPVFDGTEWTRVRLVNLADVSSLIAQGVITHSLVVAGFHWLSLYRQGLLSSGD